jgi:hypothetical protein
LAVVVATGETTPHSGFGLMMRTSRSIRWNNQIGSKQRFNLVPQALWLTPNAISTSHSWFSAAKTIQVGNVL